MMVKMLRSNQPHSTIFLVPIMITTSPYTVKPFIVEISTVLEFRIFP